MTPRELATELGIDPKRLRAWLRANYPRNAEQHGLSWSIPVDVAGEARRHWSTAASQPPAQGVTIRQRPPDPSPSEIEHAVAALSSGIDAIHASHFSAHDKRLNSAGLYSWWADEESRALLSATWKVNLPELIYAGQTGATFWPSGKRSQATLASRIPEQHIGGNIYGSTFRFTLATALVPALKLRVVGPKRLDPEDNNRLSSWIRSHLKVQPYGVSDRDGLGALETAVVLQLDPPLNLDKVSINEFRAALKITRKMIESGLQP